MACSSQPVALLLALACGVAAQSMNTVPTIVEFDVVFPRNETYAPTDLLPIVFTLQNPNVSISLVLDIVWFIGKVGSGEDWLETGYIDFGTGSQKFGAGLATPNISTLANPASLISSTNKIREERT
ncbi:hypothetical protein BX600DRAFT_433014 [Xylariales sp. PMI_506]|nr:hypothetical protein BX600DRAFT_433014 [Xylariales sp. PMI_506]